MMKQRAYFWFLALIAMGFLAACGDDVGHDDHDHDDHDHDDHGDHDDHDGHDHDPNEVMTTVKLTFTADDGTSFVASWADPENDGSPVIDPINLTNGVTYTVTVEIMNELEDPAEDVTPEILDEKDEHQFFFYGTAVQGPSHTDNTGAPISHTYADTDSQGLPVGLTNTFVASNTGTGTLEVLLRHMPPVNGSAIKVADLAGVMDASGSTELQAQLTSTSTSQLLSSKSLHSSEVSNLNE